MKSSGMAMRAGIRRLAGGILVAGVVLIAGVGCAALVLSSLCNRRLFSD